MINLIILLPIIFALIPTPSQSATDSFVYGGCSPIKYIPNSPYEQNVNSLLTSLVNSAMFMNYNNFTIQGSSQQDTIYGLFQCRGDLNTNDCSRCVARAVSQLGTLCLDSTGGVLQLDGCLVKYDNRTFLGVEGKTVVIKRCGAMNSGNWDSAMATRDAVMASVVSGDGTYRPYRAVGSGNVRVVAQCVQDLSPSECQDCLSEAVEQLKAACATAKKGDLYLATCYVRYSVAGDSSSGSQGNNSDDEIEKTLAILIGLIAGVALIIVFVSFISKVCAKGKGGK